MSETTTTKYGPYGHGASAFTERLDTEKFGTESQKLFDFLTNQVIGQDRAAKLITRSLAARTVGLSDPERPEIIVCPGPSGVGKTYTAEKVACQLIYNDPVNPPLIKIDCSEFTEHHQLSELRGSPPGYVGFGETPRFSQIRLDEPHFWAKYRAFLQEHPEVTREQAIHPVFLASFYMKNGPYVSVVVFDEVEKGCKELHHLLYGILDKGTMSLARGGEITSFRNSIIFLTMNVGDREIGNLLSGRDKVIGYGHAVPSSQRQHEDVSQRIYETTISKMKVVFPGPLIGRMRGRIVVFRPLQREDVFRILDLMIKRVLDRLRESVNPVAKLLQVFFTPEFRDFLLNEGYSAEYGAREMRQVIERHITYKLTNAIENGEARSGDSVLFMVDNSGPKPESFLARLPRPKVRIIGLPAHMATPHHLLPSRSEVVAKDDKPDTPDDCDDDKDK